jgi:hypothetical protein
VELPVGSIGRTTLPPLSAACVGGQRSGAFNDGWAVDLELTCLCVAAFGIFAAIPIFWTLPRAIVPASALTTGIATVNSIGGLSGFVDSYAVGLIKDLTGEFAGGLWFIAGFGAISIMLLAAVTRDTAWARKGGGLVVGVKARGFSTSLRRVALRWSQSRKSFQTRASGKEQNP